MAEILGRNPLKTGLSTARSDGAQAQEPTPTSSQSPENGSQHCKAMDSLQSIMGQVPASQSPENGSQHCKVGVSRPRAPRFCKLSQSPENGSQHCKLGAFLIEKFPGRIMVAIP